MEEKETRNGQEYDPGTDLFGETEDLPEDRGKKRKKKRSRTKKIILWSLLGVLLLVIVGMGVFAWHICNRPGVFFEKTARVSVLETQKPTPLFDVESYLPADGTRRTPLPTFAPVQTPEPEITPEPAETETPEEPQTTPEAVETLPPEDPDKLSGIVNVALFGIDAFEDGSSTSGSMPHTDANLVLAINFDTKEVSLISIARDCLTTAPGHSGYYKFNGVFNVGGGMDDPKAGLELSCRAAEEWLGGVSVPYYYGVDFQALIDLVDMIGGIDYNLDIRIRTRDGRTLYPGKRHMDGTAVMAYVQARKTAGGKDTLRTERQRKMLIAIFKKLKKEGKLSMIPDILKTMGDNVYTNTSLAQTTALVNFAKDIDPDSIRTYSISGSMHMRYDWAFCFIDQGERQAMIREVYGIDAAPVGVNSTAYETFLHQKGFLAIRYLNQAKKLFEKVHETVDVSAMSEEQKTAYAYCWMDYQDLIEAFDCIDQWTWAHYDPKITLTGEEEKQRDAYYDTLGALEDSLKKSAESLNEAFGNPVKLNWSHYIDGWYEKDGDINDVFVDFR